MLIILYLNCETPIGLFSDQFLLFLKTPHYNLWCEANINLWRDLTLKIGKLKDLRFKGSNFTEIYALIFLGLRRCKIHPCLWRILNSTCAWEVMCARNFALGRNWCYIPKTTKTMQRDKGMCHKQNLKLTQLHDPVFSKKKKKENFTLILCMRSIIWEFLGLITSWVKVWTFCSYIMFTADVNDGVNTRNKLKKHDSQLANLLEKAFGDGEWMYQQTSPAPLTHYQTPRYIFFPTPLKNLDLL